MINSRGWSNTLLKENLFAAEKFLLKNSQKKEIFEIIPHKLQYKITRKGKGPIVRLDHLPLVRYIGKDLDGHVLINQPQPQLLSFEEVLPGLAQGILGMKEMEKRTLYIHPDLGYTGKKSASLAPHSLLIFEVEVIQADLPHVETNIPFVSKKEYIR